MLSQFMKVFAILVANVHIKQHQQVIFRDILTQFMKVFAILVTNVITKLQQKVA